MLKVQLKELQEFITHEPPWEPMGLAAFRSRGTPSQDRAGFIIALLSARTEMYKTLQWDMCILLTA